MKPCMGEQMLWVGRSDNNRRVPLQGSQKRVRNDVGRVSEPEKYQPKVVGLYKSKHLFRKRTGPPKTEPAGTLKVVGKLSMACP